MCRYAYYGPYKRKFACFACRKMFRQNDESRMSQKPRLDESGIRIAVCPQCGARMQNLGLDFKTPPQNDVEQWKKVEKLFEAGVTFGSCGCSGPGPRPRKLKEVDDFLRQQSQSRSQWKRSQQVSQRAAQLKTLRRKRAKQSAQRKAQKTGIAF